MTSEPREVYVWFWLPGAVEPIVAGRIEKPSGQDRYVFNYGRYAKRQDAIPIYLPELPLHSGRIMPTPPLTMANALRDGAPDAWGRRVINNRLSGRKDIELDELTYMLHSGSDRIGALDFQSSPDRYEPREAEPASLDDLLNAAEHVERGEPIPAALDEALFHGSSIGGARPKAAIETDDAKYIAKFSSTTDTYPIVKAEYVAMRLAAVVGLDVAPVRMVAAQGKDALLVRRFDRVRTETGWTRRAMVSALTIFGLHEMQGRYASYSDLTHIVRARFTNARATLHELFGRMVFNVLTGNTDDHARNHAAFWDGTMLTLTPAYDICPQPRLGRDANQAMIITHDDRRSRLETCRAAASEYLLGDGAARSIIDHQISAITARWAEICDEARLGTAERDFLWGRQFLNPYVFDGY